MHSCPVLAPAPGSAAWAVSRLQELTLQKAQCFLAVLVFSCIGRNAFPCLLHRQARAHPPWWKGAGRAGAWDRSRWIGRRWAWATSEVPPRYPEEIVSSSCEIASLRAPLEVLTMSLFSHHSPHHSPLRKQKSSYGKSCGLILKHMKPAENKMYVTAITKLQL